jgi:hypothetical protein
LPFPPANKSPRSERNDEHNRKAITGRAFILIRILALVGIALSITAAVKTSTSNGANASSAVTYRKAAAALLFVAIILAVILTWYLAAVLSRRVSSEDKPILLLATLSTPFFIVRVIYLMLVAFAGPTNATFSYLMPNIWVQTFMAYVMEFIIFALFCTAGLLAVSLKRSQGRYQGGTGVEGGHRTVDAEIGPQFESRKPRRH